MSDTPNVPDKCDHCTKDKTYHDIKILPDGTVVEQHACEDCAVEQGMAGSQAVVSSVISTSVTVSGAIRPRACPSCGTTFAEFKRIGRLGCPACYDAFEKQLGGILERSHEGATHHVGKIPRRLLREQNSEAGPDRARMEALLGTAQERADRLRGLQERMREAIDSEQYELAARIRDEIRRAGGAQHTQEGSSS